MISYRHSSRDAHLQSNILVHSNSSNIDELADALLDILSVIVRLRPENWRDQTFDSSDRANTIVAIDLMVQVIYVAIVKSAPGFGVVQTV